MKNSKAKVSKLSMPNISLIFLFAFCLQSCGIYSFTGTSLSPDLETITIQNFGVATAGGPQNLAIDFNEALKEYYQRNTNLKLVPNDGDLFLAGSIITYEMTPVATSASDQAASNRLTVSVEVTFQNTQNEDDSFDKEFSFYQDFPQEQSLTDVEKRLVPTIIDQLVLNIFNDTAAQW
ncbi:LptE family protein [Arcticibacterium luteifluviistationis]|nr:LptE family protein [Arcticibacterium luteifluviistationis]